MAIIPGRQSIASVDTAYGQKQKNMVYLLIFVILLTAAIVYFGFLKGAATPESPAPAGAGLLNGGQIADQTTGVVVIDFKFLESLKSITLDNYILNDKKFQGLSLYGEFPISPGAKGRANPFEPY